MSTEESKPIASSCSIQRLVYILGLGSRWHSCSASDSESRGHEFDPHWRHRVVSLSKAH